jgi:hypothetical protein
MAGGTAGDGLVVARVPPQAVSAATAERQPMLVRMDIDDPRWGSVG